MRVKYAPKLALKPTLKLTLKLGAKFRENVPNGNRIGNYF